LPSTSNQKVATLGALRGLAALAVCWYHFTYGQSAVLKHSGNYGWLGVEVFFVISGFIIPYSLYQRNYRFGDYWRFIMKRMARLHPPYLASILITLLIAYAIFVASRFHMAAPAYSVKQLVLHLFYLNDLVGQPWVNVAYWTLAIEFQWYLFVGLTFPLIAHRNPWIQTATIIAWITLFRVFVAQDKIIFHSLPIFLVGVFIFQYRVGLMGAARTIACLSLNFLMMEKFHGLPVAYTALATGLLIVTVSVDNPALNWFGEISYSVYLLYLPIGVGLIGILSRLPYSGSYLLLIDFAGLAATLAASWVLYRWVESPSQQWSSRIRFGRAPAKLPQMSRAAAGAD